MAADAPGLNIAVIGGGVAGIVAAHILSRKHKVTLFEKESYLGGHTNTISIDSGPDAGTRIDTGFIVCNAATYPNFYRFLDSLSVKRQPSDMCFGFFCERTGMHYNGPSLKEFFADKFAMFKPKIIRLIIEQSIFNMRAIKQLNAAESSGESLSELAKRIGISRFLMANYIVPLVSCIWSGPDVCVDDFPAVSFIRFFENHGMFNFRNVPDWETVAGGSKTYVEAFTRNFNGQVRLDSEVKNIKRDSTGVTVSFREGEERFDKVILAAHADQSLKLLSDPSERERELLGAWKYQSNEIVLHTDASVLHKKKHLWASWNYSRRAASNGDNPVNVTYYMNRLQNLKTKLDYFVTLNETAKIDPSKIIYRTSYTHPVYTGGSVNSQIGLSQLNGISNTFYCGAYMRYGFHEDAVVSAVSVASHFGLGLT